MSNETKVEQQAKRIEELEAALKSTLTVAEDMAFFLNAIGRDAASEAKHFHEQWMKRSAQGKVLTKAHRLLQGPPDSVVDQSDPKHPS